MTFGQRLKGDRLSPRVKFTLGPFSFAAPPSAEDSPLPSPIKQACQALVGDGQNSRPGCQKNINRLRFHDLETEPVLIRLYPHLAKSPPYQAGLALWRGRFCLISAAYGQQTNFAGKVDMGQVIIRVKEREGTGEGKPDAGLRPILRP